MTLKQSLHALKGNKIGIAILVFGVCAFLFVAYLAYQTFAKPDFGSDEQINVSTVVNEPAQQKTSSAPVIPKKDLKRQKSISETKITGSWSARIEGARVLVQMSKGSYRIIIASDNPNEPRLYSNGTYKLKSDILILTPKLEWGPPKSKRFGYRVLTKAKMPVQVLIHKGKPVWLEPGDDADIYVPNFHPLLSRAKDKIVVFDVLK